MSDKPVISRRAILRGATIVAPTILTLHSGAALARSSNLITTNSMATANDGKYNCLDTGTVASTGGVNQYDVGNPANADVSRISAYRNFHTYGDHSWDGRVSAKQMCATGGKFEYRDWNGSWNTVTVKKGGLVSATALSSFASGIHYTDV